MSLSTALKTAQLNFSNVGLQTAVASRNIANVGNAAYARRAAILITAESGATVVHTQRAQNEALLKQNLLSISKSGAQDTLLGGMSRIRAMLGGDDYELAPSTHLARLRDNIEAFANKPNDPAFAEAAVASAVDVANSLNATSSAVQKLRAQADADIAASVGELNRLLGEFRIANDQVRLGTAAGNDVNDALDRRDALLTEISGIVGVSVLGRPNNDLALYTNDGTVLFETVPRSVTFTPTQSYAATVTGSQVYIDGVAVPAGTGGNTSGQGEIAALLQLRDDIAPTLQSQLDGLAAGLVDMFSESGMDGLFIRNGMASPADPGFAATIRVNPAVITAEGGDPMGLRDGININANPSGDASFSGLLVRYAAAFEEVRSFPAGTGIGADASILAFSTASVGWVEQLRSAATAAGDDKAALLSRTQDALLNVTAVSLDEELVLLLDLEQSAKASAKLVAAVDAMISALLQAAG